jgi:RNA-directed DNA polymerase
MEERLAAFGLRVASEKTAVRHFDGSLLQGGNGSPAGKPETFTFLGFVHFWMRTKRGRVLIERKPSVKARERFVGKVKTWLKANRDQPVRNQQKHLRTMVLGFYQYFGLHYCMDVLDGVWFRVRKCWWWALRRRGQRGKRRHDWQTLNRQPWFEVPRPRLTQAWV